MDRIFDEASPHMHVVGVPANYRALKNHYYLIQIGQFMEAWEKLWKNVKQSAEQKHRRMLESMKKTPLEEYQEELGKKIRIRFI